ncbi:MAG TPA: hypothetical protein VK843_13920 [Planctomycetota bacterium]|nr:hypothetical protein [Planctomycetota bacterium]
MSRHRSWIVGGLASALAIVVVLLIWPRGGSGSAAAELDLSQAKKPDSDRPVAITALPQSGEAGTVRDVAEAASSPEPASPVVTGVVPAAPDLSFALHGRVVVLDTHGRVLPPQDGKFKIMLWRGHVGESLHVEVHAGEWHEIIEDASTVRAIEVSELEFGDLSPTLLEPNDDIPLPSSHELEIRAQVPRGVQLRVLDAVSGVDLGDVELVSVGESSMEDAIHPGVEFKSRILGRGLNSPIAMQPFRTGIAHEFSYGQGSVLVGAPGYAWTLGQLDFSRGGDFVVSMERGGDLDVSITGIDRSAKVRLRLRSEAAESPRVDEGVSQDGTLSFLGLAPGTYTARAEIGEWFRDPIVLGESIAIVSAGARADASIVISAVPRINRVEIGGVVFVASEWKTESVTLAMKKLTTPSDGSDSHSTFELRPTPSTRPGFDEFTWKQGSVEVGKYECGTYRPSYSIVIDVPIGGRDDFELVVPPPSELSIFVVNDMTGVEAAINEVFWNPRRPEGVNSGGLEQALRDAANHRFVVRAPTCEIDLMIHSWDYLPYDGTVDLSKGVREHTVRLQPACGVILKLKDGDTLVAFPKNWYTELATVSGKGKQSMFQPGEFGQKLMVTEPGTYSVEIPKVSGYRAVPVQTIEVIAGHYTEHFVQLEREHP